MPQSHTALSIPSFDELKALAEKDPEQLEALRHQLSMELIESVSKKHQGPLLAQKSHIDRIIKRGNNPHHINILLGRELGRQFSRFADSLNKPIDDYQVADIVPFPGAATPSSNATTH